MNATFAKILNMYEKRLFLFLTTFIFYLSSFSQSISGLILNERNKKVPFASVTFRDSKNGTFSDDNGSFQITVPRLPARLIITHKSYKTKIVSVTNTQLQTIVLEDSVSDLEKVVVVGYGSMKKKDITGAISSIGSEKLTEVASNNVLQALQGRISGVQIQTTSWIPGSSPQIRIRGSRSINASNEPLFVVDGVPFSDAVNEINTNDIESIEVLKDASATAIYGFRGANGVILITTKTGKKGKTSVDYNGYYGVLQHNKMPRLMNAAEFVEYSREAQRSTLPGPYNPAPNRDLDFQNNQLVGTPFMKANMERAWAGGTYDPSKLTSTDWMSLPLRKGYINNHQISFRTGTEKTRVNFSFEYLKNNGVVLDQDYTRYSARINAE